MDIQQARKQANLRILQRTIPCTDILATATHVVLYEFQASSWVKRNTEGSMFLTDSNHLVILNRTSPENFVLEVTAATQMQLQEPYLILKTTTILGIWFHNADERVQLHTSLQAIIMAAAAAASAPPIVQPSPPPAVDQTATALAAVTLKSVLGIDTTTTDAAAIAVGSATSIETTPAKGAPAPQQSSAPPLPDDADTPRRPALPEGAVALDKKALQLALLSLVQDDRFLDLLHSQYLRVVRSRAKKQNP